MRITTECTETYNSNLYLLELYTQLTLEIGHGGDIHLPSGAIIDALILGEFIDVSSQIGYTYMVSAPNPNNDYATVRTTIYVGQEPSAFVYIDSPLYSVRNVEIAPAMFHIQLTNQCTRKCRWCPAFHQPTATPQYMSNETLDKILDLAESRGIGNIDHFSLSHMCEPTWDIAQLYSVSRRIKERFPKVRITMVSNGDWIRETDLETINRSFKFIDSISINDYDNADSVNKTKEILRKYGDSRGGEYNLPEISRIDKHCWDRERRVTIEWDGTIVACCHVTRLVKTQDNYAYWNVHIDGTDWANFKAATDRFELQDNCKYCVESIRQIRKGYFNRIGGVIDYPAVVGLPKFPDTDTIPILNLD